MAQTYTIGATGVSFALNKCLLGVFNGSGSGRIVRVYRAWILNNGTTAVTGVLTNIELRRTSAGSGGTAITPLKHDSTSESFPAQINVATNQTVTTTDLFRRIVWSNDEATANATASLDELETLVPLNCIWDVGYNDANVTPIVLREGQGLALVNIGNTSVGSADIFFEVTLAST
jgi:hypothetical protein